MSVDILDASAWREYRGRPSSAGSRRDTDFTCDAGTASRDCALMRSGIDGLSHRMRSNGTSRHFSPV